MSIDNQTSDLDPEERWRAEPERRDLEYVHAFGLYFLSKIPDHEAFDGALSVGISCPAPGEDDIEYMKTVVLGYTGDSGARLVNLLMQPDEARQGSAAHLGDSFGHAA